MQVRLQRRRAFVGGDVAADSDGTVAIERFLHDDATRTLTHIDARETETVTTFDALRRPLDERLGSLLRSRRYDPNGNLITQSDYAGHTTTFEYDDANRLDKRHEGTDGDAVRTTDYDHDALGHVLRETVGSGSETRVTEYRYEHPTYQRTLVRRRLDTAGGGSWIEEATHYDASGNPERSTDALGRTTTRSFDARDRLTHEAAPLGKTTVITYDGRDQWRTETRSNAGGSGAQVRERQYDDDGRHVAEIDATGVTRTLAYDDGTNVIQRSDGRGHLTRYRYDARNNLVEEKGPEAGQLTTYGYDGNNNRTHEFWPNGRELVHTYDAENRRLTTTDNLGLVEARTYWPDGLPKTLTDADGRTARQFHDSLHRMTREELPGEMNRVRHFTHTIHGEVKTQTDPRGHTTTFDYDALGRKTRTTLPIVDGVAAETATQYDAVGNVRFQTNARQQTTEYRYNDLNQRTDQIDPITCEDEDAANPSTMPKANRSDTAVVPANADAARNVSTSRGLIASFVSTVKRLIVAVGMAVAPATAADLPTSSASRNVTIASAAATVTIAAAITTHPRAVTATCTQSWTYDTENNVLTHTDRRGITTTNRYDGENRLLQQDRAGLTLQSLVRDAQGNVRTQTDALQRVTTFTYDKANRKTREDRSSLAADAWTYTPLGDIATHTDADDRTTVYTYTPRRFLESESLAGETTRYTYDGTGHRLTRQRPKGEATTWTYTYDAAGNLRSVTDPLAHTTTFVHDENNNRTQIIDANARITAFAYDERNRLKGKTYPGGARWIWRHDGDDNRIHSEAPNGRVTETDYDALNRPTVSTYLGAPEAEVQSTARTYDGNGNLRTIVEATSSGLRTESRDYDDFDRLTRAVDGDGRHAGYRYDDAGNRTQLVDHDGRETVWTYDALNHNTRVFVPGIGATVMTYTPAGLPDTIVRLDGSLTEHDYLDNGRLQAIRHSRNGATLASYTYVHDPNGNRTEQRETNGATTANTTQSTRYRYDDADRLTEVDEPGRLTTYTLDPVGNRTVEHVADGSNATLSHSILGYNDRDQLTSRDDAIANVHVTQTWDANGNLETQTVNGQAPRAYTYDARDRLIAMTNPGAPNGQAALTFAYHADGLRREKSTTTTTTRYQYDGHSLLAETNSLGNTRRQFHYSATQLIAHTQAVTTPTHRHVLLDALRSPIALLDIAGTVTARTSYDAFGEIRAQQGTSGQLTIPNREAPNADLASTDDQPVGFTGYLKDPESGLYYAKARYYDPATARFTTEDPEAGKDLEPPSLHRYLYAYANPTVYVDYNGRQACRGHEVQNCPLDQWTSPNRPVPQTIASDALDGEPQLAEVDADRAYARPTAALPPGQHINTEQYQLIPHVDPEGDGIAVRFYMAQNRDTGQFDWSVPPSSLDEFISTESKRMNLAAYSRTFGGTTPSNVEVQRMLRDGVRGDLAGVATHFGRSWKQGLKDPLFYLNMLGGVAGGSAAKSAGSTRALTIAEGASGKPTVSGSNSLTFSELRALKTAGLSRQEIARHIELNGDIYIFRGTSPGWKGSPGSQASSTPASIDPYVATVFGLEARGQAGEAVVQFGSRSEIGTFGRGNWFAFQEREVGVTGSATQFAERAPNSISTERSKEILSDIGMPELPKSIASPDDRRALLDAAPKMTPEQIAEYLRRAKE